MQWLPLLCFPFACEQERLRCPPEAAWNKVLAQAATLPDIPEEPEVSVNAQTISATSDGIASSLGYPCMSPVQPTNVNMLNLCALDCLLSPFLLTPIRYFVMLTSKKLAWSGINRASAFLSCCLQIESHALCRDTMHWRLRPGGRCCAGRRSLEQLRGHCEPPAEATPIANAHSSAHAQHNEQLSSLVSMLLTADTERSLLRQQVCHGPFPLGQACAGIKLCARMHVSTPLSLEDAGSGRCWLRMGYARMQVEQLQLAAMQLVQRAEGAEAQYMTAARQVKRVATHASITCKALILRGVVTCSWLLSTACPALSNHRSPVHQP